MKIPPHHPWTVSPGKAFALQKKLSRKVIKTGRPRGTRLVAGADMAIDSHSGMGISGVIVFSYPGLEIVEKAHAKARIPFPYVPGLLAFREGPVLLKAFSRLRNRPDLIMIDGQGIAHPRGLGIASHLGVILKIPTIGCAKSRLFGRHREPSSRRGSIACLYDGQGNVIGAAVRTRDKVRPVYVSIGHRIDLATAIRLTLACGRGYRVPEPTRQADIYVDQIKKSICGKW